MHDNPVSDLCDVPDSQLLDRFAARRDEPAFAALIQRHGPMVLALCRRTLRHAHDAEDAFQATFLVLARKAGSISRPDLLGNWLYGVACRTARKAKIEAVRRRGRERWLVDVPAKETSADADWADLRPVLDEEINRLSDKYRVPFVLCHLEGKTNDEVARLLGCPKGTVLSRLARARERLRFRLSRRGLALPAGLFAAALSRCAGPAVLSAALGSSTTKAAMGFAAGKPAAAGVVPAEVAGLTREVLRAMRMSTLRTVAVLVLLLPLGGGLGLWAYAALKPKAPAAPATDTERLQGTWREVAVERDGKREKKERGRGKQLVFGGGKLLIKEKGQEFECSFKLDPEQKPKTIDITVKDLQLVQQGIYRLEGDTLTVSFGKKERPREFNSASNAISILQREPPKK